MISLFDVPNHIIETRRFSNLLHDSIVDEFTTNFCKYVGAKYGCPVNSASSAIFLLSLYASDLGLDSFKIPSIIPPVVLNSIINGGGEYEFTDDIDWVGDAYLMHTDPHIIDSAQEVLRGQCTWLGPVGAAIFSFYPTKPVGGLDGGMVVSNDKELIDMLKIAVMNGTRFATANWDREIMMPGWKMYMNSVQAYIANENLKTLDERKKKLRTIRERYNQAFGYNNHSDHLYRVRVNDNKLFLSLMKDNKIICGIHYECCHLHPIYRKDTVSLPKSEAESGSTASIPFHPRLTDSEISEIISCVRASGMLNQPN